jgi:pentatricopeptide repeat protein
MHGNLLPAHEQEPNHLSLSFSLHSCTRVPSHPLTTLFHSLAVRLGHSRDVYIVNAALSSYFAASDLASADRLFAETSNDVADVVTWTTMVAGHADAGGVEQARWFFEGMPERNVVSWNAMLGAFARTGTLSEARQLFDGMPVRNAASWGSMITGIVQSGHCQDGRLRCHAERGRAGECRLSVRAAAVSGAWHVGARVRRAGAAGGHERHRHDGDH